MTKFYFPLSLSVIVAFCGCSQTPTKGFESGDAQTTTAGDQAIADAGSGSGPGIGAAGVHDIDWKKDAVIVDARSAFDFSLSHVPGAINLRWDEFTQSTEASRGKLERDLFYHARRLARLGIDPETPVIVVGNIRASNGEEGRVAWTLQYLGIKNIKLMDIDDFRQPHRAEDSKPRTARAIWKPLINSGMLTDGAELRAVANKEKREIESPLPLVLDVRAKADKLPSLFSQFRVEHISWRDFFRSYAALNPNISSILGQAKIDPEMPIVVVSRLGVEAGSVAFALRELGYKNVSVYNGGLRAALTD